MSRQAAQLSFKTAGILESVEDFLEGYAEFGTKDFFEMVSNKCVSKRMNVVVERL
jgi:hypothetical protein